MTKPLSQEQVVERFRQWVRPLRAADARRKPPPSPGREDKKPEHVSDPVSPEEVVAVYLRSFPTHSEYRDAILADAAKEPGGRLGLQIDAWAREKARYKQLGV